MKTLLKILLLVLILNSCKNEKENAHEKIYSSEFKKSVTLDQLKLIDLDSIKNFSELRKKMGEISCEGKVSGLTFSDMNTTYHLTAFKECPTSSITNCYFKRNLIFIRNDSIVNEFGDRKKDLPIKDLGIELKDIISRPYLYKSHENKVMPALIHLFVEEHFPISKTKKVLKEIIVEFEKISLNKGADFFEYLILMENRDFTITIPPPPPTQNIVRISEEK